MRKVYKVLKQIPLGQDRRFFSTSAGSMQVEYHLGYQAHSAFGPLFAFENLEQAVRFSRFSGDTLAIFESECEVFPAKVERIPHSGVNVKDAYDFWWNVRESGYVSIAYVNTVGVPFGTVFCEWLKPVREITKGEVQMMQLQILLKDGRNHLEFLQDEILKTSVEAEIVSYKHSFNITAKQIVSYLNDWLKENENNSM